MAGGAGSRLSVLARARAKPAVPFAGFYRILDFTLSNAMHSGIKQVGILTQYKPFSLMDHVGAGSSWDYNARSRQVKILPPQKGLLRSDWYKGTADAVNQNLEYLNRFETREVLILSGDHIYSQNYAEMIEFHQQHQADATVAVLKISQDEARRFGVVEADEEGRIKGFQEKPEKPRSNLGSMGIYVFNREVLIRELEQNISVGGFDFGKDILTGMVGRCRIFAFPFGGYWKDVGTIHAFWETNLDLLNPASGLDPAAWQVRTNLDDRGLRDRPPARFGSQARVENAAISPGCVIEGTVIRSVLSPGVRVEKSAVVKDSVLMHDTHLEPGARFDQVITDKDVRAGAGAIVGMGEPSRPNCSFPAHLDTGLTLIGKGAHLPADARIGRNCLIFPKTAEGDIPAELPSGETVSRED